MKKAIVHGLFVFFVSVFKPQEATQVGHLIV